MVDVESTPLAERISRPADRANATLGFQNPDVVIQSDPKPCNVSLGVRSLVELIFSSALFAISGCTPGDRTPLLMGLATWRTHWSPGLHVELVSSICPSAAIRMTLTGGQAYGEVCSCEVFCQLTRSFVHEGLSVLLEPQALCARCLADCVVGLTPCVGSRPALRVDLGGLGADRGMLLHIGSSSAGQAPGVLAHSRGCCRFRKIVSGVLVR